MKDWVDTMRNRNSVGSCWPEGCEVNVTCLVVSGKGQSLGNTGAWGSFKIKSFLQVTEFMF